MRFIINFLFFGILFYLIWIYFPDAFKTLVSWADQVVVFFRDLIMGAWHKYKPDTNPAAPPVEPNHAMLWIGSLLFNRKP